MADQYNCPNCGAEISTDDVNVAKNVALCRACGEATEFSVIARQAEMEDDDVEQPASVTVESDDSGATVITWQGVWWILWFVVPFWVLFTIIPTVGILSLGKPLFLIPFWLFSALLFGFILFFWKGKWVFTLDRGQGTVFVGVGSVGRKRRFTYNADSIVTLHWTEGGPDQEPQQSVLVRNGEDEFLFGGLIPDDAAKPFIAKCVAEAAKAV